MLTKLDLMRIFDNFEGEVSLSDFSVEELNDMLECDSEEDFKAKYFSYYNDVKSSALKKQDW